MTPEQRLRRRRWLCVGGAVWAGAALPSSAPAWPLDGAEPLTEPSSPGARWKPAAAPGSGQRVLDAVGQHASRSRLLGLLSTPAPLRVPLPSSPREGDFTPACCAPSPVLPGGPSTAGVSGGLLSETCWALASAHWPCGRVPGNEDWGGAVRQTRSRLLPWGLSELLGVHLRLRR